MPVPSAPAARAAAPEVSSPSLRTQQRNFRPTRVAAAVQLAVLGGLLAAWQPAALAQSAVPAAEQARPAQERRSYDIPAGPLGEALARFARETGALLAATPEQVQGRTSPGVRGSFSTQGALDALLAGTGLQAVPNAQGQYVLVEAASGRTLPAVTVSDTAIASPSDLPPIYAGGQVARGGRVGLLGNKDFLDTPFSQNSYTEQLVRDNQARTLSDVALNDSSVRMNQARFSNGDQFFIRGLSLFGSNAAFDGLYGLVNVGSPDLEGAERVEILRGPATALFGIPRIATVAGTINLVPKRAADEPLTRLTGRYYSDGIVGGAVDAGRRFGPDNSVGVRINGAYDNGDTPIDQQSYRRGALTAALDYRGERIRASLDLGHSDSETQGLSGTFGVAPGIAIPAAPNSRRNVWQPWGENDAKFAFGLVRLEYDVAADLTAFAAYGRSNYEDSFLGGSARILDPSGDMEQALNFITTATKISTGEAGIRGRFTTGSVAHELSVVASGLRSGFGMSPFSSVGSPINSNLYNPVHVDERSTGGVDKTKVRANVNTLTSLAMADTLSMLDDRVQLTLALRRQQVKTERFNRAGERTSLYDKSALTPAVALLVKPRSWLSVYGSYIEGLTAGPTAPTAAVNAGEVFAPVVSPQYEVGAKADFGQFSLSAALFQIEQPSGLTDPVTNRFGLDGEQRNRGLELSIFGAPTRNTRVLGGVTFLDAELVATQGGQFDGKRVPGVPRTQVNLSGEYDLPFALGWTVSARAIHSTRAHFDNGNTQSIPSWTRWDLGARYRFTSAGRSWTARLNVDNAMDRDYWQSAARGFLTQGAPRTVQFSIETEL